MGYPFPLQPYDRQAMDRFREQVMAWQPTAFWPMDDPPGSTVVRDISGNGWHATVTGSPTFRVPTRVGLHGIRWAGPGSRATTSVSIPTPTSKMTVLCMGYRDNANGLNEVMVSRSEAPTAFAWVLRTTVYVGAYTVYNTAAGSHGGVSMGGGLNDSRLRLFRGGFDGTTFIGNAAPPGSIGDQSSTTLTGTWLQASAGPIELGAMSPTVNYGNTGITLNAVYWHDRILSHADYRHLCHLAGVLNS